MSCRYKFETNYAYYVCSMLGHKRLHEVGGICSETPECYDCDYYDDKNNRTDEEIKAFREWDKENDKRIEEYNRNIFGDGWF